MATKTLLVGLGGTGCEIVSRVKKKIGTANPDIQFVGLDTDTDWDGVEGLEVIHTSREMTVAEYLKNTENWQEWFPNNPSLMNHNMINGAAQIRPLSRLAFAETISSNRLGVLMDAIQNLNIVSNNADAYNIRIMIVSSLAGGTGSGMFIQTAMFLRDYINNTYAKNPLIRGLFALPDLFVNTLGSDVQAQSVYANAYGALKELNAINEICLSHDPLAEQIKMKIDDLFDSERDRLNAGKKPFDFIFFVDNINSRGMVMSSLEEYKELMTTATYMQVYSPMTARGDSREDNSMITIATGNGKPLYGSVGASKIVYPYEDIAYYCGLRATIESIDNTWSFVDNKFKKELANNRRMRENDPTIPQLSRNEYFLSTMEGLVENGHNQWGFIKAATTYTEKNGMTVDRAESFYHEMKNYVLGTLDNNKAIKAACDHVFSNEMSFTKENIEATVGECETNLKNYRDIVNDQITAMKSIVVESIIPESLTSGVDVRAAHCITKLIRSQDGNVVHPLAVRVLLYKLRNHISAELFRASEDAASEYTEIQEYFRSAYDLPQTEKITETAIDRAESAGFFSRRSFKTEYITKSHQQHDSISAYSVDKMIAVVFADVIARLDTLIKQFERLFTNLDNIRKEMANEVKNIEENMHFSDLRAVIYVGASKQEKRALYESLCYTCSNSDSNGIFDSIFSSIYESSQRAFSKKAYHIDYYELRENEDVTTNKLFRECVLNRCIEDIKQTYADQLDVDVYTALKHTLEYQLATSDNDDTEGAPPTVSQKAKKVIDVIINKSLPYLNYEINRPVNALLTANLSAPNMSYVLIFWGINQIVKEGIIRDNPNLAQFFRGSNSTYSPEIVVSNKYSKYEISCYQALYCVSLSEIPKFLETSSNRGVFYANYEKRVERMEAENQSIFTPHLDIRWHKREYLPMISTEKNYQDDLRAARAIWLSLIYGGLREGTVGKKKVLYASFARMDEKTGRITEEHKNCELKYDDDYISIKDPYRLFKALQFDDIIVKQLIGVFTKSFNEDKKASQRAAEFTGPRARRFVKKLISIDSSDFNALNVLARFMNDPNATDNEKNVFAEALMKLIDDFCASAAKNRQGEIRTLVYQASRFKRKNAARANLGIFIDFDFWAGKNE